MSCSCTANVSGDEDCSQAVKPEGWRRHDHVRLDETRLNQTRQQDSNSKLRLCLLLDFLKAIMYGGPDLPHLQIKEKTKWLQWQYIHQNKKNQDKHWINLRCINWSQFNLLLISDCIHLAIFKKLIYFHLHPLQPIPQFHLPKMCQFLFFVQQISEQQLHPLRTKQMPQNSSQLLISTFH